MFRFISSSTECRLSWPFEVFGEMVSPMDSPTADECSASSSMMTLLSLKASLEWILPTAMLGVGRWMSLVKIRFLESSSVLTDIPRMALISRLGC